MGLQIYSPTLLDPYMYKYQTCSGDSEFLRQVSTHTHTHTCVADALVGIYLRYLDTA